MPEKKPTLLHDQPTAAPTRKVKEAAKAGIVGTVAIALVTAFVTGEPIPEEVACGAGSFALGSLVAVARGYLAREQA